MLGGLYANCLMLSEIMGKFIMFSVIVLSVMAPYCGPLRLNL